MTEAVKEGAMFSVTVTSDSFSNELEKVHFFWFRVCACVRLSYSYMVSN